MPLWNYAGKHQGRELFWVETPSSGRESFGDAVHFMNLREVVSFYGHEASALFSKVMHIRYWQKRTRFCGVCGTPTIPMEEGEAHIRYCPKCKAVFYPRISPAVIVRIEKGDTILLARNAHFPTKMHSLIAGFVEPGESLEEAVKREIAEEIAISVKDIRYYGSQHWPFPDSLMIGFVAQWKEGEISVDNEEIIAANWFYPEDLPALPRSGSIAYKMIEEWISRYQSKDSLLKT
ncbi:MAG TPA: NAD(+) diphosphatase [Synergistaceae bacterium]|nr:NAD(+) diphosphatase [Synergistaceae bacterium]